MPQISQTAKIPFCSSPGTLQLPVTRSLVPSLQCSCWCWSWWWPERCPWQPYPPATWRNGGTSLANDLTNVGKAMSETTHLEMVYTTYLWWFGGFCFTHIVWYWEPPLCIVPPILIRRALAGSVDRRLSGTGSLRASVLSHPEKKRPLVLGSLSNVKGGLITPLPD